MYEKSSHKSYGNFDARTENSGKIFINSLKREREIGESLI